MNYAMLERLARELPCPWLLLLLAIPKEEDDPLVWAEFTIAKLALQLTLRTLTTEQIMPSANRPASDPRGTIRDQLESFALTLSGSELLKTTQH